MTHTIPDTSGFQDVIEIAATRQRARVPHTCSVCNGTIAIGSLYSKHLLRDRGALNPRKALTTVRWHLPYCPEGEASR